MRFSDWQLNRLRDALRAYHHYGRGSEGDYFNWKDVSEAISLSAKLEIGPDRLKQFSERLRQFVEGVKGPDGVWKYPVPQEATLDAIFKFATDEDYSLLSEDELREHAPERHAALRLLEYLDLRASRFDTGRILPPATLEGTYRCWRLEPEDFVVRELTLQRASAEGLIQLVMSEDSYGLLAGPQFDEWSPLQRAAEPQSQTMYGGWAILTPEDNLMLFMKNADNGANCYYLTMASDLSHASQTPVGGLALLHHDYPLEAEDGAPLEPKRMPAIAGAVVEKLWLFSRIT